MDIIAYSVCPHCQGPVDVTRVARRGALDVLDAVAFALSDSAVRDPRKALRSVINAIRGIEENNPAEHLWSLEEMARRAALAAQEGDAS